MKALRIDIYANFLQFLPIGTAYYSIELRNFYQSDLHQPHISIWLMANLMNPPWLVNNLIYVP